MQQAKDGCIKKGADVEILKEIPFELDTETLAIKLRLQQGSDHIKELQTLVDVILPAARPKAIYKASYIEKRTDENIAIDGVTFTSRVLCTNLNKAERVFPFIATCGREIDELNLAGEDFLKQFWLDQIKETLLNCSTGYLKDYLHKRYALDKTSGMSPGSGDVNVWPIEQQSSLFSLFGDVKKLIGVELTDSFLMIPNKSVSGIIFPTEIDFRSCQVCHRKNCPSRSAAFDEVLWQQCRDETQKGK